MTNANTAFGARPVRYSSGAPYNGACRTYYVPTGQATNMFIGDPVIIAGDGDADGVPTITIATAGTTNRITGFIVGFRPSSTIIANGYRLASTAEYVLVADDPDLIWEMQEDAVGGALAAVDISLNADLISGTGSATTHLSGWQLDTSTKATTAGLQMRIIGFVQRPDNAIGANAKVLVRINEPTEIGAAAGTAGV